MAAGFYFGEVLEGLFYVLAALFEFLAAVGYLVEEVDELAFLAGFGVVHVDDPGDLVEGEAEAFAAQDQAEADTVAGVVDAGGAAAFGREQAAVLVEPDGPERHVVLGGQFRDRPGLHLAVVHAA